MDTGFYSPELLISEEKYSAQERRSAVATLIYNDALYYIQLPAVCDGVFFFELNDEYIKNDFVRIEANNGNWIAKCKYNAFFTSNNMRSEVLEDGNIYNIIYDDSTVVLFLEYNDGMKNVFHNYFVSDYEEFLIGRNHDIKSKDICYKNEHTSRMHAKIVKAGSEWYVVDLGSKNGTFLNGHRISQCDLQIGDVISIMSLKIIIGTDFLSLNNINKIELNPIKFHKFPIGTSPADISNKSEIEYFNRLPRKRLSMDAGTIKLDAPPAPMSENGMPLLLRMGSQVVTGASSAISGHYTSLLSSVLIPFLSHRYTEKQRADYEAKRNELYGKYLENKKNYIKHELAHEEEVLNYNYPPLNQVLQYSLINNRERLWERRNIDDDFMNIRLGYGSRDMLAKLDYPKERFNLETDELEERMYQLAESPKQLKNVPIMFSFVEDKVSGVVGPKDETIKFVQQLIMRIATLHSYDEVKIMLLCNEDDMPSFEFAKYLPHLWTDDKSTRFIANDIFNAGKLSEYLKNEIDSVNSSSNSKTFADTMKARPFYAIFVFNKKLLDSMEVLKEVFSNDSVYGVSVTAVLNDLPKECSKIIDLSSAKNQIIDLKQIDKTVTTFNFDKYSETDYNNAAITISNIKLKALSQSFNLPKTVTFLEMFKVGRIEHLNPLNRWAESDPSKSLATPIGIGTDGSLFYLDLHEKFQGPHGLVAGMTGSGKSEFIITYILSMAVNYHPDEVAFILIDYKGGGLAGAFEDEERDLHLPHLVGTITNLDGAAINRSLASIQSELKRRQHIFNVAKSKTNEGTMDIYSYQKLYRNKKVDEPLPHLFIISDEFAELKAQEPDFMDQLISTARIGRSLGVHLILATQKPSGVVNDQILSNTKFRVCLKVQTKADSTDMLKRPEAAELTDTGRFYLQVGYNEYFALGQSAWCGAKYTPSDEIIVEKDDSICFLDSIGHIIKEDKPKVNKENTDLKQIVAIVKYLSDLAKRENITSKPMWLPPLPDVITLDEIKAKYPSSKPSTGINALIGIVDDPDSQAQYPYYFDVKSCGHLIIAGESGSGKSTLIQTLLYSLACDYSPEELVFYILDFSGNANAIFDKLPHCGGVYNEESENVLQRFFVLYDDIIKQRKALFKAAGVTAYDEYLEEHSLPFMLVVIDNVASFANTQTGKSKYHVLHECMRDGSSYGIRFILSSNHMNEFHNRTKQEVTDRIAFCMHDKYDYLDALGKKVAYLPYEKVGRGACIYDERALEFHAAVITDISTVREKNKYIQDQYESIKEKYSTSKIPEKIAIFSPTQTYEEFCKDKAPERIPLGYIAKNAQPVMLPLQQLCTLSVYFANPSGEYDVLKNLVYAASRDKMRLIIVKKRVSSSFTSSITLPYNATVFSSTNDDAKNLWEICQSEVLSRKQYRDEYCSENGIEKTDYKAFAKYVRNKTTPIMMLFESMLDFCNNIANDEVMSSAFATFFENIGGFNIYPVGCYRPGDSIKLATKISHKRFVENTITLAFGGKYNEIGFVSGLPHDYSLVTDVLHDYNKALLCYQKKFCGIIMPCGEIKDSDVDIDEAPII